VLEENKNREIIASFCIASNVTGIITPYEEISKMLRTTMQKFALMQQLLALI
jgi:selenocysteine lyase/cysteine desulfurase